MYIIVAKLLVPKGYMAITLFPFIFVGSLNDAKNATLINHERIHLRQQLEVLIVPFFIWYLSEYLLRAVKYRNHDQAYRNICFEREAYCHEADPHYLKHRKLWAFTKYLPGKKL